MSRQSHVHVKYVLDKIISLWLLIFFWPVFAFIALTIKLDDGGPIFFKQSRLGYKGRTFTIWKFRTMIVNADSLLDPNGGVGKTNRITRVGRVLRATSLDELPQLINIFMGEMSIIGPRPTLVEHLTHYTDEQKRRLLMKPGVTGWAQVHGRNTLKWSRRLELDVWYIDHYSLWLDFLILLRTVKVVLLREGIVLDRNPEQVNDLIKIQPSTSIKSE